MPIYEYICQTCGRHHEALQKVSDTPLTDCPQCGKNTLQKQISSTSFRLKGGGWYETDFKAKKKTESASSPQTTKTESDSAQKTESASSSTTTETSSSKTTTGGDA